MNEGIWSIDENDTGGGANLEKTTPAYYALSQADVPAFHGVYPSGTPLGIHRGPESTATPNFVPSHNWQAWQASLHGLPFTWPLTTPPPLPRFRRWDGPPTLYPFLRPAPDTRKASLPSALHHAHLKIKNKLQAFETTQAPDGEIDAYFEKYFSIRGSIT